MSVLQIHAKHELIHSTVEKIKCPIIHCGDSRYCICSYFSSPLLLVTGHKKCDSVLIDDKYDVFYFLVIVSKVSAFVCLAEVVLIIFVSPFCTYMHVSLVGIRGVAHIVLHRRCYSSLPRVSLRSVVCRFSSTTFLCDTILMEEEKFLYSSRLPGSHTWIASDTPVREACSSGEECGMLSD